MVRFAFIIVLCSLIAYSLACSCGRPPPLRQAILDARDTDSPFAVATLISEDRPADINSQVTYTLRTEGCLKTVIATTCGNGACCGVRLQVNTKYVLPLPKNGSPGRVNLCGVFKRYNSLSAADRAFVDGNVPGRCASTTCANVLCPVGNICVNGKCLPEIPKRRCMQVCTKMACPPGIMCNTCNSIGCRRGYTCTQDRRCVRETPPRPQCETEGCRWGGRCVGGKCRHLFDEFPWLADLFSPTRTKEKGEQDY